MFSLFHFQQILLPDFLAFYQIYLTCETFWLSSTCSGAVQ